MRPALLIWFFGVVAFLVFVLFVTRRWRSPKLTIARALLRTFAASLVFAPAPVVAGYVGFIVPASAALLSYPFDSHRGDPGLVANTVRAAWWFLGFWGFWFCLSLVFILWRQNRYEQKTET